MEVGLIRILIVDDHDLLRDGLAVFIKTCSDMVLVGEASSGEEAVALALALQPDVVLMDLIMPGMPGVEAIRSIHRQQPDIRIMVLSSYVDEDLVQAAVGAGASSYLLKNISINELADAIRATSAGKSILAREATQALVNATQRPSTPQYHLTEREREVLALMVRGMNNNEIAAELIIGVSTIKKHVSSILAKLETASRTEAVAIAVRQRLVST